MKRSLLQSLLKERLVHRQWDTDSNKNQVTFRTEVSKSVPLSEVEFNNKIDV